MPRPKHINSRTVWDRVAVDIAFDRLPGGALADDRETDEWEAEV
jgi:hypothetical protein